MDTQGSCYSRALSKAWYHWNRLEIVTFDPLVASIYFSERYLPKKTIIVHNDLDIVLIPYIIEIFSIAARGQNITVHQTHITLNIILKEGQLEIGTGL